MRHHTTANNPLVNRGIIHTFLLRNAFMKILIRNLDRSTTEEELKTLFLQYGNVQYCNLVCDKDNGGSKGFAFVEMPKPGEAKAAIKNLNNQQVGSQKIRVKKAENNTA